MKIKRNGPPSQQWSVTFESGNVSVTYKVVTPEGAKDLAISKATEQMNKDPIWEMEDNPKMVDCKHAITRPRPAQKWVGGSIKDGGHWSRA